MKIVFLSGGEREQALDALVRSNANVVAVVTPHPGPTSRFLKVIDRAREAKIPIYHVDKANVTETLKNVQADLLVSCGFTYLIDSQAIDTVKIAINVHPTLLPKYRGFRSGAYVLINREKKTGVTIHYLTEEMDRGDILAQQSFDIGPFDTTKSLFRKCREIEGPLLVSVLGDLIDGKSAGVPQDESEATTFSKVRTPNDSEIDASQPLSRLFDSIRACDSKDYPAFFWWEGQKVCIKLWRPEKSPEEEDMI